MTDYMDAVSVGWSRMTWDGEQAKLSTTSAGGNDYYIPTGYQEVAAYLEDGSKIPVSRLGSKEFSGVILQYMRSR